MDEKSFPPGAVGVLNEAAHIVGGARNTTHGEKERSFAAIAGAWNAYLTARKNGGPVTGRDVAQMMVILKIIRSVQGTPARDHFVDQAGYSGVAGELAEAEAKARAAPSGLNRDYGAGTAGGASIHAAPPTSCNMCGSPAGRECEGLVHCGRGAR